MFYDLLRLSGYDSYDHYLHSECWKAFNEFYRSSRMPKSCLICGSIQFVLHHTCYERVCHEELGDVIPLCDEHHKSLHAWMQKNECPLGDTLKQLVRCFGMRYKKAKALLRPFRSIRREYKLRHCARCGRVIKRGQKECLDCRQQVVKLAPRTGKPSKPKKKKKLKVDPVYVTCPTCGETVDRTFMVDPVVCRDCVKNNREPNYLNLLKASSALSAE